MKKLNNKGITTIEVIVCFLLIVIISASMYTTVSAFNEKRIIEQYKEEITTYRDILTKKIQDDFIKIGVASANTNNDNNKITVTLRDNSKRELIIGENKIRYGLDYPLPNNISIDEISINIDKVLSIYIPLKHKELPDNYAIDIVTPINYIMSNSNSNMPLFQ